MKKGKFFILILAGSLVACSSPNKKETTISEGSVPSMYALPNTKDLDKAARLNIELGVNYLKQDQISRAKSKFIRAKELAPNLSEAHYSYGFFLERVGENEEAEKAYQKAISLNAKGGNEHNMYGAFLCRQHKYRKAEKEFLKAIDDPNYTLTAETYENAGLCVQQIPDMAKAAEYFEKALRYDPNRTNALLEMAIIKYQQKNISDAKAYHTRFTQLSQPNARSLLLGIELAKRTGETDKLASYQLLLNAKFPQAKPSDLLSYKKMS
ncbi:MAG: type IV pilus biogenesis/stability protein PilW [Gammaproteobacteria bacterium 39-13]|nr:type IV pilus biogenesis/stability protein PilW [Gammaproteobacteria bacterium]OJV88848.1 MAG: type IV pilus biogenesis/stability protein PilW [Gammaproteobacteria bacterium 39-13]